jgi:glutathione S-transferase
MLKLCGFATSNYYNKVKLQLLEKGVPFQEQLEWPSRDESYLARTPIGKVPFIEVNGRTLAESQSICEYIEDEYPQKPLYPKEAFARAKVRELIDVIELHIELPTRRLHEEAFFGGKVSDETKAAVEKDLPKGIAAFLRIAKFAPYVAGVDFTLADCAAIQHLPLTLLATKKIYGRDFFADWPAVGAYIKEMNQRPLQQRVIEDRKANTNVYAQRRAPR